MLFQIKNRQELEDLEELVSLKNQVEEFRILDKLGKQNFHENRKKVFEPVTDPNKNTAETLTKTMTETYINNQKELENSNDHLLEIVKDRGLLASYLLSALSKTTTPENTSQFKLRKSDNLKRVNDLLIHNTITVTVYNKLLTCRDTGKNLNNSGIF